MWMVLFTTSFWLSSRSRTSTPSPAHHPLATFAQGDVVQKEGRSVTTIYFPLSGMLSLLVVLKGGRTVETCVVGWEGMVGARAGLGNRHRASALLPSYRFTPWQFQQTNSGR
jgi:hypothetical protein